MDSKRLAGVGIGIAIGIGVVVTAGATCTGTKCTVEVSISSSGGKCRVALSSAEIIPLSANEVEWKIVTTGYSFVPGAGGIPGPSGITMLNDANEFEPLPSLSVRSFKLQRSAGSAPGRVYLYNVNVQRDSDKVFCIVPTLPRIKND